jgi:ornithine racemase
MGWPSSEKKSFMPRIEISLSQIRDNAQMLVELYGKKGISLMGVSKAVLGEPAIIEAMIQGGVQFIADSRLENIQKMRAAGIITQFVLLRTAPSCAEAIVQSVDISLNTEIDTLRQLSYYAKVYNKIHQVMIMVELGDLREGVMPQDLAPFIQETLTLPHLKIVGIGCNLACHGGVKPDRRNMQELSALVDALEKEFQLDLKIISGGNSANYDWGESTPDVGNINNLRLGEAIFLGCETTNRRAIPGLHRHAFQLVAEVIEAKDKPSIPTGEICQDAFGHTPIFLDRGVHQRSILALGQQDVPAASLKSHRHLDILGASSDHLILDSSNYHLQVGDGVKFDLDYSGLLAAMTSPFIRREFVGIKD